MNLQLLMATIIAAIGFGSGWHLQTLRYTAKEAQYAEQKLAQIQQSAAANIRRLDNVIDAQRDATSREVALRRDRDSAHSELERLRIALQRYLPRANDATTACTERDNTVRELFAECAAQLTDLAGKADRHASDAMTLQQAWPK